MDRYVDVYGDYVRQLGDERAWLVLCQCFGLDQAALVHVLWTLTDWEAR